MTAAERQRRRKTHLQACETALKEIVAAYEESEREIEAGGEPGDAYDLMWQAIERASGLLKNR